MKRYDLGECEQFGAKQFWNVPINERWSVWVSYNTAVAIVDHDNKEVFEGHYARGYSRTTSKQVGQAYSHFADGYRCVSKDGNIPKYLLDVFYFEYWDGLGDASHTVYAMRDAAKEGRI